MHAAEIGDALVAQIDEMARDPAGASDVVGYDEARLDSRQPTNGD